MFVPLHVSLGPLFPGSSALLYGRVPPDRLPPAHPSLQHHAAEQRPPRLTACPAGGGGGRRGPLPAPESRRRWRGDALAHEPLQPWQSDHFWIKTASHTRWKIKPSQHYKPKKKKEGKKGFEKHGSVQWKIHGTSFPWNSSMAVLADKF